MSITNNKYNIDLIMLSKFDKNDGGRETWLYTFFPELLSDERIAQLNIFGYRNSDEKDNTAELIKLDRSGCNRVHPFIFNSQRKRYPRFFSMFLCLKKFLTNFHGPEPDFVLAVGFFEVMILLSNRRFKNKLKIVWLRGIFTQEKAYRIPSYLLKLFRRFEVNLLKKMDILIANGDDIRDYYKKFDIDLQVIKNSVDGLKWRMPLPSLEGRIKVAYIGRLSAVKGIESFISLVKRIKTGNNAESFDFHIVGRGDSYLSDIEKLERLGFVKFHGNIANECLPEFLREMDVCVALTFASSKGGGGGTSNALLEQMAAGRIIVAWNNIIFRQLLNNECSYLVKQDSIEGLELALMSIFSNRSLSISKGKQAIAVVKPYTIEAQVDMFKQLILKEII